MRKRCIVLVKPHIILFRQEKQDVIVKVNRNLKTTVYLNRSGAPAVIWVDHDRTTNTKVDQPDYKLKTDSSRRD